VSPTAAPGGADARGAAPSLRARLRAAALAAAPGAGRPTVLGPGTALLAAPAPRLLVVRPDHLGDVLLAGPALRALCAAWPAARVTFLVGPWAAAVAERMPGAHHVATLAFPWFDRRPGGPPWRRYARLAAATRAVRRLPAAPFHAAVVLRDDDYWSAWVLKLAGVPLRLGHADPCARRFLSHVLPPGGRPEHVAAAGIALVAALVGHPAADMPTPATHPLCFQPSEGDRRAAREALAAAGLTEIGRRRPIAVHPGSGSPIKRWRWGAWRETLAALTQPGEPVVVTGTAAERRLTAELANAAGRPVVDLTGRTDVGTLAAVFERCRLVMGPDSGPLHLAVAAGTPTVHLFGPADARRFGPWGPPQRHAVVTSRLPCAPCGRLDWPRPADHPCVRTLAVEDVVRAARGVLAAAGAAGRDPPPEPCGTP